MSLHVLHIDVGLVMIYILINRFNVRYTLAGHQFKSVWKNFNEYIFLFSVETLRSPFSIHEFEEIVGRVLETYNLNLFFRL